VVLSRVAQETYELHCHGGAAVGQWLSRTLEALGCPRAEPLPVWHRRHSPTVERAWHDLPRTATPLSAGILLEQARGALHRSLAQLVEILSTGETQPAQQRIEELLSTFTVGRHLLEPFRVLLAGPTNAGKSSLLNRLLGYRRAVTHTQSGTTRDILTADAVCRGFAVTLIDGAGIRTDSSDPLERAGMERVRAESDRADLTVWLVDGTTDPGGAAQLLPNWVRQRPHLAVVNKADLPVHLGWPCDWPRISARDGRGVDSLWDRIGELLVGDARPSGAAVVWREEQATALRKAADALGCHDIRRAAKCLEPLVTARAQLPNTSP